MDHYDVLIVGGGHAGAQAAVALRQAKFEGSIAIIGEEPDFPYERPPLSKEYFAGDKPFERILIRPPNFWLDRDITMLLGQRVEEISAAKHSVTTGLGASILYRTLIWAAGGTPRSLECKGNDLEGVCVIRTRADVDGILSRLHDVRNVVIIGGGYIGLEAAAVLTKLGKQVTLFEAMQRVLSRVAGEPLSRFYEAEHRSHGVDIRLGVNVSAIEGNTDVEGVRLEDGSVLPAQMVIVGIGIIPSVTPLLTAGAVGQVGVEVDAYCRTSLPDIYAIGDCAEHQNAFAGGTRLRVESVQNANDMATSVAKSIAGEKAPYSSVPWFWSNQYDLRLQTIGLSVGYDDCIVRGDPDRRSFSVVYTRNRKVIALDCVNATKDYVQGRALVENGLRLDPADLSDSARPLKDLAISRTGVF